MFAVDHVLVSDAIVNAPFACHLGACRGACCVVGDRGAPLDPDERAHLEHVLPVIERELRPEARKVIREHGTWIEDAPGEYAVTTVDDQECTFVIYDRGIAKCAIQQAFLEGRVDWPKPISCHLFPIRIQHYGEGEDAFDVLNYEEIYLCEPAVDHGARTGVQLADFLQGPLSRKYGDDWYQRFRAACHERAKILNDARTNGLRAA